ncbi:hypothetical protein V8E54_013655 [Elaphomyces granulatus]
MNSESNSTPTQNTPSEHTTISITMTQATELPDKLDQTLNAINTLNSKKQFDNWMEIVEAVLDQYEIASVIDRKLPRSTLTMLNTPSGEKLQSKSVVKGHGRRLSGVIFIKATNIRRDRFATVDQFVKEFKSLVKESNQLGCPITPYCAAMILLSQLENEFRPWVEAVRGSWSETIETDLTEAQFLRICNQAIDQSLSYQNNEQFSAIPSQKTQSTERRGWQPFKNSPKRGDDIEAHGCEASLCPYLIENPPNDWRPDRSKHLWCYSASKRSRERRAQEASQNEIKTLPNSTLANTEGPIKDFYFSPFQGLAVPINDPDIIESETATKNEESFIHDEEFIGREPNISRLAIANNTTGGWICDTVSMNNIVGNLEDFIEYHPFKPGQHRYQFGCSNGTTRQAEGYGTALMRLELKGNGFTHVLLPSYYVPNIRYNLFACEKAKYDQGIWYMSKDNTIRRMHDDAIIGYTTYEGGIPMVKTLNFHKPLQTAAIKLPAAPPTAKHEDKPTGSVLHRETCRLAKSKWLVSSDLGVDNDLYITNVFDFSDEEYIRRRIRTISPEKRISTRPPEPESSTTKILTSRRSNKGMPPIRFGDEQAAWINKTRDKVSGVCSHIG